MMTPPAPPFLTAKPDETQKAWANIEKLARGTPEEGQAVLDNFEDLAYLLARSEQLLIGRWWRRGSEVTGWVGGRRGEKCSSGGSVWRQ